MKNNIKFKLNKDAAYPLYLQLADSIEKMIARGELSKDAFLANEREFATDLKISRITVRKAFKVLEEKKIIHKIRGRGVFTGPPKRPCAQSDPALDGKIIGISSGYHLELSHTAIMINSASEYLQNRNFHVMKIGCISAKAERENFEYLHKFVNGVLIRPSYELAAHEKNIKYLKSVNIPCVLIGHNIPAANVDYIGSDDRKGAREATECLINAGQKRIAYIANNVEISTAKERFTGYSEAMKNAGLEELVISAEALKQQPRNNSYLERGRACFLLLKKLSKSNMPTAIIAENDLMALGVYEVMKELKIKIPSECELFGFGDDIEARLYSSNGFNISTIAIPREEIGRQAAEKIIEKMLFHQKQAETILLPTRIIHRGTSKGS